VPSTCTILGRILRADRDITDFDIWRKCLDQAAQFVIGPRKFGSSVAYVAMAASKNEDVTSIPPVVYSISPSADTLSLSGQPPFYITIKATSLSERPIWAFISLFSWWCYRLRIRDPSRTKHKIGPSSTCIQDEWDEEELDREDAAVVRLTKDQPHELRYRIEVQDKLDGLRGSDTRYMTAGNEYPVTLDKRRWRWMYEDDMPSSLTEQERRDLLYEQRPVEWAVDCQATLHTVS